MDYITVTLKSGGVIKLDRPFIAGNGIVGNLADGKSIRIPDEDIISVAQWKYDIDRDNS